MSRAVQSGFAPVNGASIYWESRGEGGTPLLLVHGGFGLGPSRLAILPGATHYDILDAPSLPEVVARFLA